MKTIETAAAQDYAAVQEVGFYLGNRLVNATEGSVQNVDHDTVGRILNAVRPRKATSPVR